MAAQQLPRQRFLQNLRSRVIGQDDAVTLVIGDIARWTADGRSMPTVRDVSYIEYEAFGTDVLIDYRPDVILSPLVTDTFDAFLIARVLSDGGFAGRYRAVSPHLPNLAMVKSEIVAAAPAIDFEIVVMPPTLVSVS